MNNGITIIKPIKDSQISTSDLRRALLKDLGCSISGMPNEVEGNIAYSNKWEYFNPRKVTDPEALPEHWKMVFDFHNKPEMRDCRELKYRYVHCPTEILPQYPRVDCKGIFGLCDNSVRWNKIAAYDLIHIGNEFVKEE